MSQTKTITIDGTEYALDSLSEAARMQVDNLRATETELTRTQNLVSMLQAARVTYAELLKKALPKPAPKRSGRAKAK